MDAPILRVKLLSPDATVPTRAHQHDAGWDLYAAEDVQLSPYCRDALVSTGVAVAIPEGYYGRVASRSSLSVKHNVEVGAGVVDAGYRGEVKVKLYHHEPTTLKIAKGDRIAQLVITKIGTFGLQVVDELPEAERADRGFGSSGK